MGGKMADYAMGARVVQGFVAMVPPTVTHNDLMVRRGRGGKCYIGKSDRLREAEDAICARLRHIAPDEPVAGPARVTVRLCFPTGGRHAQGEPMADVPDLDNIFKTLGDCMVRCGLIEDDRLIVQLSLAKAWSDPAGIWVRVEAL